MAGGKVDCECGHVIVVPSLSELKRTAIQPAATKPKKKLSWRKKLGFTALLLLICAGPGWLLAEIIYRTVFSIPISGGVIGSDDGRLPDTPANRRVMSRFRRSDNPILGYEPMPGARSGIYSVNASGFRDHEYAKTKAPGVFRIAMLGDSIVWGHGLELQDTFAKQLERMLNENTNKTFEVLNFGVSGYSTRQEVELYRVKASEYDPDLVIVGYCLNDFMESSVEGSAFKSLYYGIFSKSYLYDHLRRVIAGVSYNQFGYMSDASQAQFDLREQFRLLDSYCEGQRNVVVVFPHFVNDFDNYIFSLEHCRIGDALSELNFSVLDLIDVYRDYDAGSFNQNEMDRVHPNAFGTRLAAQATMDFLIDKKLAPLRQGTIDPTHP
jgi:hypothetical protein